MAANETSITIVGNLTGDPELKVSASGTSWVRFAVASTPRMFDKTSGQYRDGEALFLTCTAFRQMADHIAESLSKGTRVIVTGRLKQHRWQTPDGDNRTSIGLDVEEIGPSLRFANAQPQRLARTTGAAPLGDDDPWASASTGPTGDNQPPF
ncbi:MAG: single-stranded DNA-binding protein [Micromonosporaceae bacterium]|nr:single-stranded DNA-binding protein [Micromonosporaceae bacterium]